MKTKRILPIVLTAAILLFISGCWAYQPQCVDIPLVEHKGDVKLDGGVGYLEKTLFGHLTAAAGLTDHISVQGHIRGIVDRKGLGTEYVQIATGYYNKFNRLNTELYLGYGFRPFACYSYSSDAEPEPREREDGSLHISFTQFNLGWNSLANSHIDIAFGLKVGYMHDSRIRTNYYYDWGGRGIEGRWSTEQSIVGNRLLLEPTAEIRAGWTYFKPSLIVGYFHTFPEDYMYGSRLSIRLGLTYRF